MPMIRCMIRSINVKLRTKHPSVPKQHPSLRKRSGFIPSNFLIPQTPSKTKAIKIAYAIVKPKGILVS